MNTAHSAPDSAAPGASLLLSDSSVHRLLTAAAEQQPNQPYLSFDGCTLTFAELSREVGRAAGYLQKLGVVAGDRVAVMLDNHPRHVMIIFALISLGAVWVPINTRQRGEPLAHQLRLSRPCRVVAERAYACEVTAVHSVPVEIWEPGECPWSLCPDRPVPSGGEPDGVIALMFTSGTSGPAKAVRVTDRMLRASALGAALTARLEPDGGGTDVLLMWEPLCHIGGAQVLLLPLVYDARIALLERFSASRFWDQARQTRATHIHHLGGILSILLARPASAAERQHNVRLSWGGGVDADTWHAAEQRFGIRVTECYGMTEASSIVTINHDGPDRGVGRPVGYFEVEVHDRQGRVLPDDTRGEIVLRPRLPGLVTPGYWNDELATSAARRGEWWRTGDSGFLRDGAVHFSGRLTDSVRHRGENVSAWEVESVANRHPAVSESALIGVPGPLGEEDLALFVTPAHSAAPDPHELITWCQSRLPSYMVPQYIMIIDRFDKTPSQRIIKGELRRRWSSRPEGDATLHDQGTRRPVR